MSEAHPRPSFIPGLGEALHKRNLQKRSRTENVDDTNNSPPQGRNRAVSVTTRKRQEANAEIHGLITAEVASWVRSTLGLETGDDDPEGINFLNECRTGNLLCKLYTKVTGKKTKGKLHSDMMVSRNAFFARENVLAFIKGIRKSGVSETVLFSPDELVEGKNEEKVMKALLAFSLVAFKKYGVEPPEIIRMQVEIDNEEEMDLNSILDNVVKKGPSAAVLEAAAAAAARASELEEQRRREMEEAAAREEAKRLHEAEVERLKVEARLRMERELEEQRRREAEELKRVEAAEALRKAELKRAQEEAHRLEEEARARRDEQMRRLQLLKEQQAQQALQEAADAKAKEDALRELQRQQEEARQQRLKREQEEVARQRRIREYEEKQRQLRLQEERAAAERRHQLLMEQARRELEAQKRLHERLLEEERIREEQRREEEYQRQLEQQRQEEARRRREMSRNAYRAAHGDVLDRQMAALVNKKVQEGSMVQVIRLKKGCYQIGTSKKRVHVRELRGILMCRVGGGWEALGRYIERHATRKKRASNLAREKYGGVSQNGRFRNENHSTRATHSRPRSTSHEKMYMYKRTSPYGGHKLINFRYNELTNGNSFDEVSEKFRHHFNGSSYGTNGVRQVRRNHVQGWD